MKAQNLTGQKFGRWTVVRKSIERRCNKIMWECVCECGTTGLVATGGLNSGGSKSCGCWDREAASKRLLKHGDTINISPEYYTLSHMISRCHNPNNKYFHNYGGKGLEVFAGWRGEGGYERFLAHVGRRPSGKHSIDRIDNSKGYEPGNVRWATRVEQNHNKGLHKANRSGISGVWRKVNKWQAYITADYKRIQLVTTDDFFEACCARKAAENEYWRNAA